MGDELRYENDILEQQRRIREVIAEIDRCLTQGRNTILDHTLRLLRGPFYPENGIYPQLPPRTSAPRHAIGLNVRGGYWILAGTVNAPRQHLLVHNQRPYPTMTAFNPRFGAYQNVQREQEIQQNQEFVHDVVEHEESFRGRNIPSPQLTQSQRVHTEQVINPRYTPEPIGTGRPRPSREHEKHTHKQQHVLVTASASRTPTKRSHLNILREQDHNLQHIFTAPDEEETCHPLGSAVLLYDLDDGETLPETTQATPEANIIHRRWRSNSLTSWEERVGFCRFCRKMSRLGSCQRRTESADWTGHDHVE